MTDLRALLTIGQQVQGRLAAIQTELANRTVTGSAGGGMVTVTADGRGQVRDIRIDPSLLGGDVEMLEDLVLAAVTEVQKKAADIAQDEIKKVQSALPFPLPFSL
ncbi:MAG: nucleoid-associated protein, YbaB/EbfC family [Gemmatimonadetes bacterium GWC2_71_9]|jgi:DNA-binding YbaB/EbfC family protein|nr:MAG: nucleoid-associated protein, YbaB/EbfC family [Gemmatimonadetes bacterium GWC2_71_9]